MKLFHELTFPPPISHLLMCPRRRAAPLLIATHVQARIRVHSMASDADKAQRLREGIRHTLHGMRVKAEVHMAIIDAAWLGA